MEENNYIYISCVFFFKTGKRLTKLLVIKKKKSLLRGEMRHDGKGQIPKESV